MFAASTSGLAMISLGNPAPFSHCTEGSNKPNPKSPSPARVTSQSPSLLPGNSQRCWGFNQCKRRCLALPKKSVLRFKEGQKITFLPQPCDRQIIFYVFFFTLNYTSESHSRFCTKFMLNKEAQDFQLVPSCQSSLVSFTKLEKLKDWGEGNHSWET